MKAIRLTELIDKFIPSKINKIVSAGKNIYFFCNLQVISHVQVTAFLVTSKEDFYSQKEQAF
jgi:5'(3')-deoxyribonucleotidase